MIWNSLVTLFFLVNGVTGDTSSSLQNLFDEYYQWRLKDSPELATYLNVHDYDNKLDQYSLDHMDFLKAKVDNFLTDLHHINYQSLSKQDQINYAVLNDTLSTVTNNYQWRLFSPLNPLNFLEGGQVDPGFSLEITPFKTRKNFEDFLARLEGSPQQIDGQMTLMKEAILLTRTNNAYSMTKVPGQIGNMIKDNPIEFIYYKPFIKDLEVLQISEAEKAALRTRAVVASAKYIEALRKLKNFIEHEYMPHARGTFGVGGLSRGGNLYADCLRWHTTTDKTPGQVHQIGLNEVDRISKKMKQIMHRQNFNGTIAEYFKMLSQDPKFHFKTGDEIIAKYRDIIYNRFYPALPKVFKNLPPYRIKVSKMANDGYPAQYQPGSSDGTRPGEIQANVYRPNETDSYTMVGLALHEAVPGHHLQFSKQQTSNLPKFRKEDMMGARYSVPYTFQGYSAYVEGWALYAEFLGEELGLYVDDYELMGRYGNEIMRACRLVVDTGIHFMGWSREQALNYFQQYSDWSGGNLANEVDRYITWPGQACAYKIGEMKIRELREKAETTLGSKFDIKDFHEVVLTAGTVSLSLLESIVEDWISETLGSGSHQGQGHGTSNTLAGASSNPLTFTGHLPIMPSIG